MEQNNNAAIPDPSAQTTGTAADQPTATNEGNAAIVEQLKSMIDEKFNSMAAKIRRIEQGQSNPPKQVQTSNAPATEQSVKEELQQLRQQLQIEKEEAYKEKKEAAISTALSAHGIDSENAEFLSDHIQVRYAANIKVDGRKVFYEDPTTGEQTDVKSLVGTILKTKGDKFRPAVSVPNGRGLRPGTNQNNAPISYSSMPESERQKLSPEQQLAMVRAELAGQ
jgi:hypothetical protein